MPRLLHHQGHNMSDPVHCDDLIDDESQPKCLREFLRFKRTPAISRYGETPPLFATIKDDSTGRFYRGYWDGDGPVMDEVQVKAGTRVRVVMASRFGDVGITTQLQDKSGYMLRVPVAALHEFSDAIGEGEQ